MSKAARKLGPSANDLSNEADVVDLLPRGLRECVHEYGWSVVRAFLDLGIREPRHIHHLIRTVWLGSREMGNRRGPLADAIGSLRALDDLLIRAECKPIGRTILRVLRSEDLAVVRREPTQAMLEASLSALDNVGFVTKELKHRMRLRAAIRAGERAAWPFLDGDS